MAHPWSYCLWSYNELFAEHVPNNKKQLAASGWQMDCHVHEIVLTMVKQTYCILTSMYVLISTIVGHLLEGSVKLDNKNI